jgi:hypothetical protein
MLARPRIRQLTLGELLDETFRIYRRDLLTLIALATFVIVPFTLLDLLVSLPFLQAMGQVQQGAVGAVPDEEAFGSFMAGILFSAGPGIVFGILYTVVFQPIMEGALTRAVTRRYLDRPVGVGDSMGAALRRAFPLILARFIPSLVFIVPALLFFGAIFLLDNLGAGAGLAPLDLYLLGMACLVPVFSLLVLALYVRVLFTSQGIIAEGLGPIQSLRRSWSLVTDYFWRTLGFVIVIGIISWLIQFIPGAIIGRLLELVIQDFTRLLLLSTVVDTITRVLITPFTLIAYTLMYYDLRIRKEGFDLEQQAHMLITGSGSPHYGQTAGR